MDVEELQAACIELLREDQKEVLHDLIAQLRIGVTESAKAGGIDVYCPGWRHGTCIEYPPERRREPAGAGNIAAS